MTLRRRRGFLGIEALWLGKVVHVRFAISASRPWKMGGKREYVESIRKGLAANNRAGKKTSAAIKEYFRMCGDVRIVVHITCSGEGVSHRPR